MSSKYEMRVSPDGEIIAIRRYPDSDYPWETVGGPDRTDAGVKGWTPLLPQPPRWETEKLALDEYSMLWEQSKGRKGDHMEALAHVVGVLLYGDPIAPEPEPKFQRQWGVRAPDVITVPITSVNVLRFTLRQLPGAVPVIRTRLGATPWPEWRELTDDEAKEAGIAR